MRSGIEAVDPTAISASSVSSVASEEIATADDRAGIVATYFSSRRGNRIAIGPAIQDGETGNDGIGIFPGMKEESPAISLAIDDAARRPVLRHHHYRPTVEIEVFIPFAGIDTIRHYNRVPINGGVNPRLDGGVLGGDIQGSRHGDGG